MNKKSINGTIYQGKLYQGFICIVAAAVLAVVAVTLYGRTIQLNYIEQIHLQNGYLYYVDRGENEELKIIRSDPAGKKGDVICCDKHEKDKYRVICQLFFDDAGNAYALVEEIYVEPQNTFCIKVYQCDFAHGKLKAT